MVHLATGNISQLTKMISNIKHLTNYSHHYKSNGSSHFYTHVRLTAHSMASDQYFLRSGKRPAMPATIEKPNRKRKRVHEPTKPDPPETQTTSKPGPTATSSSLESLPTDTRMLFQKPDKWTLDHLRVTNLQREMDVPLERIIPAKHIPHDDPGKSASVL